MRREDVMSFKLTLRSGVKFSDGTPYDAAAVVKNFQRIMDPKNRCRCVSDLSDHRHRSRPPARSRSSIKMKSPSAHFPATLADVAGMVASPAAVEKYGADFGNHGIGAGPFKLKEWRRGAQIVFERNPDYWRKPRRCSTRWCCGRCPTSRPATPACKAGNLDIVTNAAARDVSMRSRRRNSRCTIRAASRPCFVHDQPGARRTSPTSACARRWPMRSTASRYNKAINRGLYKIANTPFGTGLFPHEQVDGYPTFDPAKAKKLVEEYGKPIKIKLVDQRGAGNRCSRRRRCSRCGRRSASRPRSFRSKQVQLVRTAAARDYQVMLYPLGRRHRSGQERAPVLPLEGHGQPHRRSTIRRWTSCSTPAAPPPTRPSG